MKSINFSITRVRNLEPSTFALSSFTMQFQRVNALPVMYFQFNPQSSCMNQHQKGGTNCHFFILQNSLTYPRSPGFFMLLKTLWCTRSKRSILYHNFNHFPREKLFDTTFNSSIANKAFNDSFEKKSFNCQNSLQFEC